MYPHMFLHKPSTPDSPPNYKKFSFPKRRKNKMNEILQEIINGDDRKHFCIVPIRLRGETTGVNPEYHTNTLIIWKHDRIIYGYIVEPHGFFRISFSNKNI